MTAHLVRGDARTLPLATGSVQCVVTSPPYMGLRSYGGQVSIWGGDPDCPHTLEDGPALKPMTGGTGPTSGKQLRNNGSQFGNAWADNGKSPQRLRNGHGGTLEGASQGGGITLHPSQGATCTRCGAMRCELGSEPDPQSFVAHLVEVFRECWRVLRDDGCLFLNMGDSYSGSGKGPTGQNGIGDQGQRQGFTGGRATRRRGALQGGTATVDQSLGAGRPAGSRPKSLLLVPERLAIALSDDGWVIRSRIAWCKAAPMPESVDDRPTSAWEHIWQLTKSNKALFWTHRDGPGQRTQPAPDYRWQKDGVEVSSEPENAKEDGWKRINLWRGHDYYWDAEAVKQPLQDSSLERGYTYVGQPETSLKMLAAGDDVRANATWRENGYVPTGANMRNFWLLGPDPYSGPHYAVFPRKLVELCVKSASSEYGACAACGAAWRRTTEHTTLRDLKVRHAAGEPPKHAARIEMGLRSNKSGLGGSNTHNASTGQSPITTTTGWQPTCKCDPAVGVRPCVVLDPFSGSATVPFQAARMGRIGIGVELSESYIAQAQNGRLAQGFLPLAAPPQPAALRLPLDGEVTA